MTSTATPLPRLLPALILGVVQGLTEFLPISSSGHLVVGSSLLGFSGPSLLFDLVLHLGTLVPVIWLYRRDLLDIVFALGRLVARRSTWTGARWRTDRGLRLGVCVAIGSLPTALMGLLLNDLFERLFSSPRAVGVTFILTGGILMLSLLRRSPASHDSQAGGEPEDSHLGLTPARSLLIGLAQGFAITPGISRSGTTISAALLLGIERTMAARFSFLLAIPAILGAVALHLSRVSSATALAISVYLAGALAAAVTGYLALRILVGLVKKGSMHLFSFYLWPLGVTVLVYTIVSK